jgi:hypothetical protein
MVPQDSGISHGGDRGGTAIRAKHVQGFLFSGPEVGWCSDVVCASGAASTVAYGIDHRARKSMGQQARTRNVCRINVVCVIPKMPPPVFQGRWV